MARATRPHIGALIQSRTLLITSGLANRSTKGGTFLSIEPSTGSVLGGPIGGPGWWNAQWKKVTNNEGYFLLQNRQFPNRYLHIGNGFFDS